MAAWPVSLPQTFQQGSYKESFPNQSIATKMDTGPEKVRRRFTAAPYPMVGRMWLTLDQSNTLETFYLTTLKGGSLTFTFTHPRTLVTITCRMKSPPGITARADAFTVSLNFTVLP